MIYVALQHVGADNHGHRIRHRHRPTRRPICLIGREGAPSGRVSVHNRLDVRHASFLYVTDDTRDFVLRKRDCVDIHLPWWFPGASFKKEAAKWAPHIDEMVNKPYQTVKD